MSHYETPTAVRNDAHTLAEEARALFAATAEATDVKVVEARRRLDLALSEARNKLEDLKQRACDGARAADQMVRAHPYESVALAFGIGALLGCLIARRN